MDWVAELYIVGSGLISVFVVLLLLYVSMLAMSALAGRVEFSKTGPPANEQVKK